MNKESVWYNFPVQFPFGRSHPSANGAVFALLWVFIGLVFGIILIISGAY